MQGYVIILMVRFPVGAEPRCPRGYQDPALSVRIFVWGVERKKAVAW